MNVHSKKPELLPGPATSFESAEFDQDLPPSEQFSDYLYHFTGKCKYLIEIVERQAFVPRYVFEEMSFLSLPEFSGIEIPMTCFCDIPTESERIISHLDCYGGFGIGLSKKWGVKNRLQPVHYLNPISEFTSSFKRSFLAANSDRRKDDNSYSIIKNNLLVQLVYFKPVYMNQKCVQDDCEWRYVPDMDASTLKILYPPLSKEEKADYNGGLLQEESTHLPFEYGDIIELIVSSEVEQSELEQAIMKTETTAEEKARLCSIVRVIEHR